MRPGVLPQERRVDLRVLLSGVADEHEAAAGEPREDRLDLPRLGVRPLPEQVEDRPVLQADELERERPRREAALRQERVERLVEMPRARGDEVERRALLHPAAAERRHARHGLEVLEERPVEHLGPVRDHGHLDRVVDIADDRDPAGLDEVDAAKQELFDATGLELGFAFTTLFQGVSDSAPGTDDLGAATIADLTGAWHLVDPGRPTAGRIVAHGQGAWNYGTTGPEDLGHRASGARSGRATPSRRTCPPSS
jgi:hypothetical protein